MLNIYSSTVMPEYSCEKECLVIVNIHCNIISANNVSFEFQLYSLVSRLLSFWNSCFTVMFMEDAVEFPNTCKQYWNQHWTFRHFSYPFDKNLTDYTMCYFKGTYLEQISYTSCFFAKFKNNLTAKVDKFGFC